MSDLYADVRLTHAMLRKKYVDSLKIQTALRTAYPAIPVDYIAAACAQCALHERAERKLHFHPASILNETAVEQASSVSAAELHASLFAEGSHILEICSGIGSDSITLAHAHTYVTCVEADQVSARMLRHNLTVNSASNAMVLHGTAEEWMGTLNLRAFDAVFADPSRRQENVRTVRVEHYSPTLEFLKGVAEDIPTIVKAAPASNVEDPYWKKIFVAVGNECKEQLLVHGFEVPDCSVADADTGLRWIPEQSAAVGNITPHYLIEPHNAIIRSGFVREYMAGYLATPLDNQIAYGLSEALPGSSHWHRRFRIHEMLPFSKKLLQKKVREYGWGPGTEIKKRGFPLLPDELRNLISWKGSNTGVLFLTRQGDEHIMILAERIAEVGGTEAGE